MGGVDIICSRRQLCVLTHVNDVLNPILSLYTLWLLGRQCVAWPTSSQPASQQHTGRQAATPAEVRQPAAAGQGVKPLSVQLL